MTIAWRGRVRIVHPRDAQTPDKGPSAKLTADEQKYKPQRPDL